MKNLKVLKTFALTITSLSLGIQPVFALGRPGSGGSSSDDGPTRIHQQNRSTFIKDCEKLAQTFNGDGNNNWNAILRGGDRDFLTAANISPAAVTSGEPQEKIKSEACSGDGAQDPEQLKAKIADFAASIALCEAYRVSTLQESYSDEHIETFQDGGSEGDSTSAGNMLECMNQPDQAAQQQCMAQAQSGPQMNCRHEGPETHDYLKCKSIINFVTGFALGKQAMQIQQGFRQSSHDMDNQEDFLQRQNNGEGNMITDSMGLQRDSLEKQGNLAYEMAVFDGAKAATLLAMINSFPKSSQMQERCVSGMASTRQANSAGMNNLDFILDKAAQVGISACRGEAELPESFQTEIVQAARNLLGGSPEDELCSTAVNDNNHFFLNHEAVDALKQQAMQAGLEALANAAKGALAHKQAGYIDDAIKDVEEFEPPEFPIAEIPESTVSECLVDPSAEGCVAPSTPGSEGFAGQDFSATFGGSANLGDLGAANLNTNEDNNGAANVTDRDLIPEAFGGITSTEGTDNSFSDGSAGLGSIKTGQAAAGAGGGAGGGSASLGGGGGGGRGPAAKQASSASKGIKVKTKGSGLGGFGGGRGAISRSKKSSSNPFAKLLGKDKSNGNKTLNFRGPAQIGNKKGSLFEMISNRYSDVQEKKRLLKYEKTN